MRVIIPTLAGLVALAATSVQAAPVPYQPAPAREVARKPGAERPQEPPGSDYLVATNSSFRAYRMRKECGPIRDAELRASCVGSFNELEPR